MQGDIKGGDVMATLAERREARMAYMRARKKPLGEGSRFAAIERMAELGGARNPAAVAAMAGRKRYGKEKFQAMALRGRKKKKGKASPFARGYASAKGR